MATTDVADVRDAAKDSATTALHSVRAQAASAGETLSAAVASALDTATKEGKKAKKRAKVRARELADEAAKSASASARKARKRAEKAAKKAAKKGSKKAKKRAHDLSVAVQEKAGRKPKRGRKRLVLGGVALGGVAIATVVSRKKAESQVQAQVPPSEFPSDGARNQ
jgi:hypothetical protein